jgi:hypothetical protein
MNPAQYRIAQCDPVTWQLSTSEGPADWNVIGNFSSASAAVDAMRALIARATFTAPAPTFMTRMA